MNMSFGKMVVSFSSASALLLCAGCVQEKPRPHAHLREFYYTNADQTWSLSVRENGVYEGVPYDPMMSKSQLGPKPTFFSNEKIGCVKINEREIFAAPKRLVPGEKVSCGTAKFEVVQCSRFVLDQCTSALIRGYWLTRTENGTKDAYIPIAFFFDICTGIQDITFDFDTDKGKVDFGSSLQLRSRVGLLSQENNKECSRRSKY